MLTGAEVNKLFDLLRELHGKDKPRDGRTAAIWGTVLEPWDYPQVRGAALARARVNRYYPDPAELTAFLPAPPRATPAGATAPQVTGVSDAKAKEEQAALYAQWRAEAEELAPRRRAAGLAEHPWASECVPTEWFAAARAAGLEGWSFALRGKGGAAE